MISDPGSVFILQCKAEDISMQQGAKPSASHLENFKSTVSKTAQCSLIEEHKEREGELRG